MMYNICVKCKWSDSVDVMEDGPGEHWSVAGMVCLSISENSKSVILRTVRGSGGGFWKFNLRVVVLGSEYLYF